MLQYVCSSIHCGKVPPLFPVEISTDESAVYGNSVDCMLKIVAIKICGPKLNLQLHVCTCTVRPELNILIIIFTCGSLR